MNELWGSRSTDSQGRLIENWIKLHDELVILNNGQPTHFNCNNGSTSAIDLTIASAELTVDLKWEALYDLYDSDHFPIFTRIVKNLQEEEVVARPKWILDKANWSQFKELIEKGLLKLHLKKKTL